MDRYQPVQGGSLGKGSYGEVYLARHKTTGEIVAVKSLKSGVSTWEKASRLPEVRALLHLSHPHIVRLREAVCEGGRLSLIFEHMERSLLGFIQDCGKTPPQASLVRSVMSQVYGGIAHMHSMGVFHRDLKPENILLRNHDSVKIADLGSAKPIRSQTPFTEYIATRWYRAPELLLRSRRYSWQVDVWAAVLIYVEVGSLIPLFPADTDADVLHRVSRLLGPPPRTWEDGAVLAVQRGVAFPQQAPTESDPRHAALFRSLGESGGLRPVMASLEWDPSKRPQAADMLLSPLFVPDTASP